ncbi:DUF2232 domain-containing protein [Psychrobacillus sp.]|uniref:YybS family protein n=1 Tax=Psychrobacillus sp. TaxID=1871623 RepID=UPI0028BD6CA8|nr:DUF2232 domain-containing protein [Psychrobacillus sp.]
MQTNQTKFITSGIMMIALFAIIMAFSLYVPFVGFLTLSIVSIPIALYSSQFERKYAIVLAIMSVAISYIIAGVVGVVLSLLLVVLGFIIGDSIRNEKSKLYMLMASIISWLFMITGLYIISILVLNVNVLEKLLESVKIYYEQTGKIMSAVGQLPEAYNEMVASSLLAIQASMPFYFIAFVAVFVFVILTINLFLLKKLKVPVPKFSKFMNFRLPKAVLWYYLIVSIFSLFVSFDVGTFGYVAVVNAMLILRILLFLQGVSLIHYYFYIQGWPKWAAVLATLLSVPLFTFTIILGVFDLGFKVRKFLEDRYKK